MGFLDWMRNGNAPKALADPDLDPKTHRHRSWKDVYAEMRADEGLAKARNETGREPESGNQKANYREMPQSNERPLGWQPVGVYLYRADGRYPPATWAETPQQFAEMIPKIREQIDNKLEVRITNGDDNLLFHATQKGIEWDGIRLGTVLDEGRNRTEEKQPQGDVNKMRRPAPSWER